MVSGMPCLCIRHTSTLREAAISRAPSACKALTSLIRLAPACMASFITWGLEVSIEIGVLVSAESASITGMTRLISSASLTALAPGRVDSPPISIISTP